MRSAGNFHPEWGYLAPAPSFMRTVRIALVATAIGAIGGAVVVVSLVERPGSNDSTAIAAHALLTRAPVITSPAVASRTAEPAAAKSMPSAPQPTVATSLPSAQHALTAAPAQVAASLAAKPDKADSISPPLPLAAPTDGAVAAAEAAPLPAEADAAPDTATESRTTTKRSSRRHRSYEPYRRQENTRNRWHENGGFGPLFRLFSFRVGSPYSSN